MSDVKADEMMAEKNKRLLARMYFIAILPFIGSAVAPWVVGPEAVSNTPIFLIWSASVLIFICGGWLGYSLAVAGRFSRLHILVNLIFVAAAIAILLVSLKQPLPFIGVAFLTVIHWCNLFWMQKTKAWEMLEGDIKNHHLRFSWAVLACHMLVLFNLIYQIKMS